jgi:hypothetical protein
MAARAKDALGFAEIDVIADRGYFCGPDLLARRDSGIHALVPKPDTSNARAADETFLIQVLMGPLEDQNIPRMPFRGPFATGPQVQVIREWINEGACD